MAFKDPLHEGQLELLRWVGDGCPDGRWQGHSYKTTANALAGRRLITVSKKGGGWSATLLPAGTHYLEHRDYPPGHWQTRRAAAAQRAEPSNPATSSTPPVPKTKRAPRSPRPKSASDEPKPTQKLLRDLLEAGGRLVRDVTDDPTNYSHLAGIINGRGMVPGGDQILISKKANRTLEIRLASVSDWTSQQPGEIAGASKSKKNHPAVAELRANDACSAITPVSVRARAFRILNALAREASTRDIEVSAVGRDRYGYRQDRDNLNGDLIFELDRVRCSVMVVQLTDKVPHEATAAEVARQRRGKYASIREYDYVPSERLQLIAHSTSRFTSTRRWSDTKSLVLEYRLPDVLDTLLEGAASEKRYQEEQRRAEIARHERRDREDVVATEAYYEQCRIDRLLNDFEGWDRRRRMIVFLDEMEQYAAQLEAHSDREAAPEWAEWCRGYVAKLDPFARAMRMPSPEPPAYSDLMEFRTRLGFGR